MPRMITCPDDGSRNRQLCMMRELHCYHTAERNSPSCLVEAASHEVDAHQHAIRYLFSELPVACEVTAACLSRQPYRTVMPRRYAICSITSLHKATGPSRAQINTQVMRIMLRSAKQEGCTAAALTLRHADSTAILQTPAACMLLIPA
jgi:hypothetical protein